jgi:hypothetical protein
VVNRVDWFIVVMAFVFVCLLLTPTVFAIVEDNRARPVAIKSAHTCRFELLEGARVVECAFVPAYRGYAAYTECVEVKP